MLKKFICLLIVLLSLSLFFAPLSFAIENENISAQAAILLCPDTGDVLFSRNEHHRLSMASTTKIMTALLAVESNTPELNVIVSKEMVSVEGSSMGLLPGDSVSLKALSYGMMLESGNDAANVTAHVLGDSLQGFSRLMNEKAKELGMSNTNFVTPSGLDAETHYSTAYDMGILAAYALENPEFVSLCSEKSVRVEYGNPPYVRTLSNHNRLMSLYDGCFGVKTGFTKKSGRCLVSAAERNGVTLIAVTLNAPNDWADHSKMFDYGFETMKSTDLPISELPKLRIVGGESSSAKLRCAYVPRLVYQEMLPEIYNEIYLKPFEYAPVKKGQIVGSSVYKIDGQVVADVPLIAAEDIAAIENIEPTRPQTKNKITDFFKSFFKFR